MNVERVNSNSSYGSHDVYSDVYNDLALSDGRLSYGSSYGIGGGTPVISNIKTKKGDSVPTTVTAPDYVLEESISSQKLWNLTAQNRPVQPAEERSRFEEAWIKNFEKSKVDYKLTRSQLLLKNEDEEGLDDDRRGLDISFNDGGKGPGLRGEFVGVKGEGELKRELEMLQSSFVNIRNREGGRGRKEKVGRKSGDITVLYKGNNLYGTTVSKR